MAFPPAPGTHRPSAPNSFVRGASEPLVLPERAVPLADARVARHQTSVRIFTQRVALNQALEHGGLPCPEVKVCQRREPVEVLETRALADREVPVAERLTFRELAAARSCMRAG